VYTCTTEVQAKTGTGVVQGYMVGGEVQQYRCNTVVQELFKITGEMQGYRSCT